MLCSSFSTPGMKPFVDDSYRDFVAPAFDDPYGFEMPVDEEDGGPDEDDYNLVWNDDEDESEDDI